MHSYAIRWYKYVLWCDYLICVAALWGSDHLAEGLLYGDHVSACCSSLWPRKRNLDPEWRDGCQTRAAEEWRAGRCVWCHLRLGQESGAVQPGWHRGGAAAGCTAHELRWAKTPSLLSLSAHKRKLALLRKVLKLDQKL